MKGLSIKQLKVERQRLIAEHQSTLSKQREVQIGIHHLEGAIIFVNQKLKDMGEFDSLESNES